MNLRHFLRWVNPAAFSFSKIQILRQQKYSSVNLNLQITTYLRTVSKTKILLLTVIFDIARLISFAIAKPWERTIQYLIQQFFFIIISSRFRRGQY